jgi:hypothetical protein
MKQRRDSKENNTRIGRRTKLRYFTTSHNISNKGTKYGYK